jgi:rod shape-determining protein MreC
MKQYLNFSYSQKKINNYSLKSFVFGGFKKIELGFFIILAIIFLITSKVNRDFTNKISYFFVDISLPIVNFAVFPFNAAINLTINFKELVNAKEKNEILLRENQEMRASLIKSIEIANENEELKDILKFVVPKALKYSTANVIGKTHQTFSQQLFLQSRDDVILKNGSAVVNEIGMIGRVIDSVGNKARLLLITDSNSKIPVVISNSRVRGILKGNNSETMEIIFVPKEHNLVEVGDLVFTATDGEALPTGLLLGMVSKVSGKNIYVETVQDIAGADVVSVLEY